MNSKSNTLRSMICFISITPLTIALCGCSDSSSEPVTEPSAEIDSSYLDDLAAEQQPDEAEPEATEQSGDPVEIAQNQPAEDEQRDWVRERDSQSTLGRTRDRAKDLANKVNGGNSPDNGIADTYSDENYASTSGYRWDMPEDWRMAVPASNHFAEMYIQSPGGAASVSFSKESDKVPDILRSLGAILTDDMGGRSRPKTSKKTILGLAVTVIDLKGTYIDPMSKGGKNMAPFYAMHAAIVELPNTRVLIKMWGPEDTLAQSITLFDAMVEQMRLQ